MTRHDYDLVIVGGGSAGQVAAPAAARQRIALTPTTDPFSPTSC